MEKKYAAPKRNKDFKKYWNLFLPQVVDRPNFHDSYLQQLEVLCDLYVDYHKLTQFINENGYSIISEGRYGVRSAAHVEVAIREKTVSNIRALSKMLGLVLDKGVVANNEGGEWD